MWPEWEKRGLPEALLFGIMAKESNGRVHASSRAGAAGLMQFMPATGRRFGLGPDGTGFDTRFDARSAAEASASYLNERPARTEQQRGNVGGRLQRWRRPCRTRVQAERRPELLDRQWSTTSSRARPRTMCRW